MSDKLVARLGASMRTSALALAAVAVMATAANAAVILDPGRDTREWSSNGVTIRFSVPETYGSCVNSGLTDRVYTTGVPDTWVLRGQILIGYQSATNGFVELDRIVIDTTGNIDLTIQYPPRYLLGLNALGLTEYRVIPQIEIFLPGGVVKATGFGGDQTNADGTLGPGGQDWDVYCRLPPPPPPGGGNGGCTPGYWKQPQHFDSYAPTGVQSTTMFNSKFVGFPLTDVTWVDALQGGGGSTLAGARAILRRAAAAAYLNAGTPAVNYGFTQQQVVDGVLAIAASTDRQTILQWAAFIDGLNNRGCLLN